MVSELRTTESTTFAYIYHPDCGFCKKSAPIWEQFVQDFKSKCNNSDVKIVAINLSSSKNRQAAKPGQKVGQYLEEIGPIKTVPIVKLFKNGAEYKYDSEKNPRSVENYYKFLQEFSIVSENVSHNSSDHCTNL